MKKINAKIYYDEDFPGKFFIKHDNGRVEVANVVTPKRTAQRGGYAFFFRDADKKSRNISEQRVQRNGRKSFRKKTTHNDLILYH